MRKVIVTEFLSLDGVMEEPAWTAPYWNDAIAKFKGDEQDISDTLLLGRVTYQGFAAAWPESEDEGANYIKKASEFCQKSSIVINPFGNGLKSYLNGILRFSLVDGVLFICRSLN